MTSGIYAYWDKVKGYYAYVGRDINIDAIDNRDYDHNKPSKYDEQEINKVLQNNPDRYEYRIIIKGDYNNWQLNQMEKLCIKSFKTFKYDYPERSVFNFTKGGGGRSGYKLSDEEKQKLSELNKGENHPQWKGYPTIQKCGMHRGKQNYCVYYKGKEIKWSTDRNKLESFLNKNYETIINGVVIKKKPQYKMVKDGKRNNKQVYAISYEGKRLKTSIYIDRLEKWFEDNYPNEKLIKGV